MVDAITFRYLINLVVHEKLYMHLMDVVTSYLYGSFDSDIYMKIPKRFKMPKGFKRLKVYNSTSREMYLIKFQRLMYGLKQSRRMWYNRLSEYLIKE